MPDLDPMYPNLLQLNYLPISVFAYSLDPDQAQQKCQPDLDPNCLTL